MDNHIPTIYNTMKEELLGELEKNDIMGALSADGWRKKAAAQGTPMINVMINPPDGGSVFLKVSQHVNC
jgi:hypothetical protein